MTRRLLFVGDIHLGRRPSALSEVLRELGREPADYAPSRAWMDVVHLAISEGAAAVVLAGDVVDTAKDRFEAYGHLARGAEALAQAGIHLYAVAGNHDGEVLPKLAARLPSVHLLGQGGHWERVELEIEGSLVDLIGWSFPSARVERSPLSYPGLSDALDEGRQGATRYVVLHGDAGVAASDHGPLAWTELRDLPVDGVFLGHIHVPSPLNTPKPVGYLGSLIGLDGGETGVRGPWWVHPSRGAQLPEQVEVSRLRWETLELGVDQETPATREAVHMELETHLRERVSQLSLGPKVEVVGVKVTVVGPTTAHEAWRQLAELSPAERCFRVGGLDVVVRRLQVRTRLPVDEEALRKERTPIGTLMELSDELLAQESHPLVEELMRATRSFASERWGSPELSEDVLREVLLQEAQTLVYELVSEREDA